MRSSVTTRDSLNCLVRRTTAGRTTAEERRDGGTFGRKEAFIAERKRRAERQLGSDLNSEGGPCG